MDTDYICNANYNFVLNKKFKQFHIGNGIKQHEAIKKCKDHAKDKDFFIQQHSGKTGHTICGIYDEPLSHLDKMVDHSHTYGALCSLSHGVETSSHSSTGTLAIACDFSTTKLIDGKCVSSVNITTDNASVCDPYTTEFVNGKCISSVDITTDNASVCDPDTTEFVNGKCISSVDITTDNASVCDPDTTEFVNGKCVSTIVRRISYAPV
tara:strand:+ start:1169 stop:1795 length:627 start_codon:yes stop_codon:yes gene_type:complete